MYFYELIASCLLQPLTSVLFKVFISYSATQTVSSVAILFFQLYQSLCVARVCHVETTFSPHAYDMVVFGFQLFEYVESPVAECLVGSVAPISEK